MIENALKISQDWIEAIASESNKSKQICYQSLQEVVQVTLAIFPVYIHEPGERCLLGFSDLINVCCKPECIEEFIFPHSGSNSLCNSLNLALQFDWLSNSLECHKMVFTEGKPPSYN